MTSAGTRSASVAELVAAGLAHAVCSCSAYVGGSDELVVDSFDRSIEPFVAGEPGGDVGINTALSLDGPAQIGGSLRVAGSSGVVLAQDQEYLVRENLAVGGPLLGGFATLRVTGDAEIAGRIDLGALYVGGALTQPAGETRTVGNMDMGIGEVRIAEVIVPPPCACGAEDLLDVATLVSEAQPSATELAVPPLVLDSRCEVFVLSELDAPMLDLVVRQSAALLVPGDLQIFGDLTIHTENGAELDVFVAGNVLVEGRLQLGTEPGQGPVRIHVGGAGTIQLTRGGEMQGALYAPRAGIVLGAQFTLYGAMTGARVDASAAPLTVHYDRSLGRPPQP
jgi:hypothetical protein